jgi:hypothetical protein
MLEYEDHIYRDAEWPEGLRCAACGELFVEGQPISERLDGMVGDDFLVVLVCVPCNLAYVPLAE